MFKKKVFEVRNLEQLHFFPTNYKFIRIEILHFL